MATKKYPLDPLAKLRDQHVEDATSELAAAVREREAAERRQPSGLHPARVLGPSLFSVAIDVPAPRHGLRIDDPRPVIGERSNREIRGERIVDHSRNVRGAGGFAPLRRPHRVPY